MNLYTIIKLLDRFQLGDPSRLYITVNKIASKIIGTSAELKEGDILSVEQLMYGMMLPSGNDAAFVLAEYFGEKLKEKKYKARTDEELKLLQGSQFTNTSVKYFLKEMNFYAYKLKMNNTLYDSPHGLMNKNNYSTAEDVAILISEAMRLDSIRRVVGTKEFRAQVKNVEGHTNEYHWINSNRLLGSKDPSEKYDGILGCKTGIT